MKNAIVKEKRSVKQKREKLVLFGVIEHYIRTGKAVGSNTLKEAGFKTLSSATIRNYFATLEKEGFLLQQHISGGRIPTEKAYRYYANEVFEKESVKEPIAKLKPLAAWDSKEITALLQFSAETVSDITGLATFISAPRFDHDFIVDLKIVPLDLSRAVCLIITEFGSVKAEIIKIDFKLTNFIIKRVEEYFQWRLKGFEKPEHLTSEEESFAESVYNEMVVRFVVGHTTFLSEDLIRVGFSKLLSLSDFQEAKEVAPSLALFENTQAMRLLLRECFRRNKPQVWIGEDLKSYSEIKPECAVMAVPYHINRQPIGAIGVLGPIRMPYKSLFGVLEQASSLVGGALTKAIYKFKITYRQPDRSLSQIIQEEKKLLSDYKPMLLEDKSINKNV